ncbi:MAG: bifunctional folylpolyglutamate synthase/dihydrofolate synthase [Bacilli bacterium]|nr:bifunctional folylpolyglutamate synthase/dihydrofolate synthase [Bacilli bacterium]
MNKFTNIQDFLSFVENQKRFHEKKSLDNMKFYCEVFNNPQNKFKTIHVTGTNGKGSVVSYLKNMFLEHGFSVGTFTSPYITKFNERICYNQSMIEDEEVLFFANKILEKYPLFLEKTGETPSFFEFITLLCFLYFENKQPDISIIEVGIGGTLDSTNVITPIVSTITNVSFDHMNVLGNSLEEILSNKLGIVKKNIPFVVGLKDANLIEIAEKKSSQLNSKIYKPLLGAFEIKKCDLESTQILSNEFGEYEITLPGIHQVENSLVAIQTFLVALTILNKTPDFDKVKIGLLKTKWPGRLEVISREPLIVLDGGHNVDGVNRVCEFVDVLKYSTKRCIFACSDNKEKEKMIGLLEPHFDQIIITSFTYKRHSSAKELFDYSKHDNKILMEDIDEIIEFVQNKPYELNLFLGSLYFVSEIRPKLKK